MFENISARERLLLIGLGLFVVAVVVYFKLWQPHTERLDQLRHQKLPESVATLAWMKQAIKEAGEDVGKTKVKKIGGPLLTVIETSATQYNMRSNIKRIQPNDDDRVKVWLEEVKFNDMMQWVQALKAQNVEVQSAAIEQVDVALVDARLTVGR